MKIMIVESNALAARTLKKYLESSDYDVIGIYETCDDIIQGLDTRNPDVILMDISLQSMSDDANSARTFLANSGYPIVFISGKLADSVLLKIAENMRFGHVTKPVSALSLDVAIKTTLANFNLAQNLQQSERRLQLSTQILELLNQSERKEDIISDILFIINSMVDFSAVGIRLFDGQYYPYYDVFGPFDDFADRFNHIQSLDDSIMCSKKFAAEYGGCYDLKVLKGEVDTTKSYFTMGGSFWSNDVPSLIGENTGGCVDEFLSMAFIPLKSDDRIIGHLNFLSLEKNAFDIDTIRFFERVTSSIGLSISRKQTHDRLKAAYDKSVQLEKIINRSPVVTFQWLADTEWKVEFVSDSIRFFGYEPSDFYSGKVSFLNTIHEEDKDEVLRVETDFMNSDQQYYKLNYRIKTYFGKEKWIEDHTWKELDEDGNIIYLQGLITDITKRHMAYQQVTENEKILNHVLKGIKAAIVVIDVDSSKIVDVDTEAERLLGQPAKQVLTEQLVSRFYLNSSGEEAILPDQDGVIFDDEVMLKLDRTQEVKIKKTIIQVERNHIKQHIVVMFDMSRSSLV